MKFIIVQTKVGYVVQNSKTYTVVAGPFDKIKAETVALNLNK